MINKNMVWLAAGLTVQLTAAAQTNQQLQRGRELAAQMTLEERIRMVVGMGMKLEGMPIPTVGEIDDKVPGAAGTTFALPRLGIPTTVLADGPAGVRIAPIRNKDSSKTYYATAFPVATLVASTWDVPLAQKLGHAMGAETKAYGIDILLAPALNIHRNPLGGRNFEYFSEDPIVSGRMAAAVVNGMEENGIGASIKHYAANNQETNRNQINTIVSQRALREIYLRGFEIAVKESQPWTVMSSYNRINGVYASESYELLTTILRKEWGFRGYVMTDWYGGSDPVAQMKAGNDLLMPGLPEQVKRIKAAVEQGLLSEAVITENAARILAVSMQGPAFANPKPGNSPDLTAHARIARQVAAEGTVLLQNNGDALPLKPTKGSIACFGNTSYDFISGGTGSGDVNEAYTVSLVQGLQTAGYGLNASLQKAYTEHLSAEKAKQPKKRMFFELLPPLPEMKPSAEMVEAAAANSAVALITIGRNSGEFQDRKETLDFNLTPAEQNLINLVSSTFRAKGKPVVVVLNVGGVVETASWRNMTDAIVLAWQGGQEAGNALTDVLSGKVNPSGKLTMSFPVRYSDVPSAKNFPGIELSKEDVRGMLGIGMGKPSEVVYEEGIYVGYRYYNSYQVPVAFPFGHGLSYTRFTYSKPVLVRQGPDGSAELSVVITNSGKLAGKEAVQLYVSAPLGRLHKPAQELKAFAKTKLLKPGESQTLRFVLSAKDLASYHTDAAAWIAEAGTYQLLFGASATDIRQRLTLQLPKEMLVERCNPVLLPERPINEWQGKHP